jgi:inner membrane protein
MDSFTQIVLGAAVGEAVLGRRIGNRAVLWGAIAGTIPDLDVIPGYFMNELDSLGFHRGPSHSLLFSLLMPFPLAWLTRLFYEKNVHNSPYLKWSHTALVGLLFLLPLTFLFTSSGFKWAHLLLLIFPALGAPVFIKMRRKYVANEQRVDEVGFLGWYMLFFLGFFTHVLLDCFTTYGTQILLPFSDIRVAWNTISVVDPFYTIPFLVCLIITMRLPRLSSARRVWNYVGIAVSTFYLFATLVNKYSVNTAFSKALEKEGIEVFRFHSTPTMFNNALWFGIGETDSGYYHAYYSIFDKSFEQIQWEYVDRGFDANTFMSQVPPVRVLKWFSDGFYQFLQGENDTYIWRDLRFGNMNFNQNTSNRDFVFFFTLKQLEEKQWVVSQQRPEVKDPGALFKDLFKRIKGKS